MDGKLIGKEMPTLCQSIIFEVNDGVYRVQNTRKHCSHKGGVRNTNAEVYAKIGLQFAATAKNSKTSGGEMVAMKYRLWWCTPATRVPPLYAAGVLRRVGTGTKKKEGRLFAPLTVPTPVGQNIRVKSHIDVLPARKLDAFQLSKTGQICYNSQHLDTIYRCFSWELYTASTQSTGKCTTQRYDNYSILQ